MQKVYPNAAAVLDGWRFDGMTIARGGFGLCGIPARLIDAIEAAGTTRLTCVSNHAGIDGVGLSKLLRTRRIAKMIGMMFVSNEAVFDDWFVPRLWLKPLYKEPDDALDA